VRPRDRAGRERCPWLAAPSLRLAADVILLLVRHGEQRRRRRLRRGAVPPLPTTKETVVTVPSAQLHLVDPYCSLVEPNAWVPCHPCNGSAAEFS
jgi:hypothetical protein